MEASMEYGICVPTYIDMWREVVAAEEAGFTTRGSLIRS